MFMSYTLSACSLRCVMVFNMADQHERSNDVKPRGLALRLKNLASASWVLASTSGNTVSRPLEASNSSIKGKFVYISLATKRDRSSVR